MSGKMLRSGARRKPDPGYAMYLTPCVEGRHGDCGGASNTHYLELLKDGEATRADVRGHVHACQCLCHGDQPVPLPGEARQQKLILGVSEDA